MNKGLSRKHQFVIAFGLLMIVCFLSVGGMIISGHFPCKISFSIDKGLELLYDCTNKTIQVNITNTPSPCQTKDSQLLSSSWLKLGNFAAQLEGEKLNLKFADEKVTQYTPNPQTKFQWVRLGSSPILACFVDTKTVYVRSE